MPLTDTPKKRDCQPSPEQVNSRTSAFREAYSSNACARKNWNGATWLAAEGVDLNQSISLGAKHKTTFYIVASGNREDIGDQKTEEFTHRKKLPSSYLKTPVTPEFRNRNSPMQLARNKNSHAIS